MPPCHGALVSEMYKPSFFQNLRSDSFCLFDALDQPLDRDVGLGRAGVGVEGGGRDNGGPRNLWDQKEFQRGESVTETRSTPFLARTTAEPLANCTIKFYCKGFG